MAKKRKRRKKRSLPARLMSRLLSAVDWLCESFAALCMGIFRGVFSLIAGLVRLIAAGVWLLVRLLIAPFAYLWRRLTSKSRRAEQCHSLTGSEFEAYVALILRDNGFRDVKMTGGSGDQGVDILAERNGRLYAIQCKNYKGSVGNFAVQEAFAGAQYYGCDRAAVICPGTFTRAARELAQKTGVLLWDAERLSHMMRISGRKPHHRKSA